MSQPSDPKVRKLAEREENDLTVTFRIVSSPESNGPEYGADNLLHDDGKYWASKKNKISNLSFIFETEQAHAPARFDWRGRPNSESPARMSLEAQVGEVWTELSTWDAPQSGHLQSQTINASVRSTRWRLTLLANHGSPNFMALQRVKLIIRQALVFRIGTRLFQDRDFTDVEVLAGDRRFPAHRAVLAAASPVFSAMLRTDMREARSGEIRLEGADEESVQIALEYIYTGALAERAQVGVVVLAHQYQIPGLMELAAPIALQNVVAENVAAVLRMLKPYEADCTLGVYWGCLLDLVRGNRNLMVAAMREY